MDKQADIVQLVTRYFKQQIEIGGDLYLDRATAGGTQPHGMPVASTLRGYHQEVSGCTACRLSRSRTNSVFGVGSETANLMCVGEGPGREEDLQGEPFVGAAGQLLNKILAAIGFERAEVYITNIVKCRPPQNRNPEPDEAEQCLPFLTRQIELVKPAIILALGRVAARYLLGRDEPLSDLRKNIHHYGGAQVIVTYHPAALLRNPQWKRKAWDDVRRARELYDEIVGDKPALVNKS